MVLPCLKHHQPPLSLSLSTHIISMIIKKKKNTQSWHHDSRLRDKKYITARHLKNWHQQLNQTFLTRLPEGIVQQPFTGVLRMTLLSCEFPSADLKALRWYSWMLWHSSPALISNQMKGLGDFPVGLCIHLNGVMWNSGSYIKKFELRIMRCRWGCRWGDVD